LSKRTSPANDIWRTLKNLILILGFLMPAVSGSFLSSGIWRCVREQRDMTLRQRITGIWRCVREYLLYDVGSQGNLISILRKNSSFARANRSTTRRGSCTPSLTRL
jgi:hypothetical protein